MGENKELETEEVSMESEDVPKPEIESQLADVAAAQEPENAASPIKSQDVIYSPSFYTHMVSQSAIPVHSAETPLQIASPVESPQVAGSKGEEKAETESELAEKAYDRAYVEAFVDAEEIMADYKGETPLYRAALNGNTEIVKMLLDAGADPNGEESMETEDVPKPEESSQATNLAAVVPEPTSPVKSEAESAKEEDNKAEEEMKADTEPADQSPIENVAVDMESEESSGLEEKSQDMDKRVSTLSKDIQLARKIRGENLEKIATLKQERVLLEAALEKEKALFKAELYKDRAEVTKATEEETMETEEVPKLEENAQHESVVATEPEKVASPVEEKREKTDESKATEEAMESEEAPIDTEVTDIMAVVPEPEKKAAMPDAPMKVAAKSKDNKLARRIRGEGV